MGKSYTLLALGIWITVLPYLGFPYAWKDVLFTISGIFIILLSFALYKEYKNKVTNTSSAEATTFDNFSENDFSDERQ